MQTILSGRLPTRLLALFLLLVLMSFAGCTHVEGAPTPSGDPVSIATEQAASDLAPTPGAADVTPEGLLDALLRLQERSELTAQALKPLLHSYGVDAAALAYRPDGMDTTSVTIAVDDDDLYVRRVGLGGANGVEATAVLRLNFWNYAVALLFEQRAGAWAFSDWFPCGAPETKNDAHIVTLQTGPNTYSEYLILSGLCDGGSARQSVLTNWYDLTSGKQAFSYMSSIYSEEETYFLGYDIEANAEPNYSAQGLTLYISYDGTIIDPRNGRSVEERFSNARHNDRWVIPCLRGEDGAFYMNEADAARMSSITPGEGGYNAFANSASITLTGLRSLFPGFDFDHTFR